MDFMKILICLILPFLIVCFKTNAALIDVSFNGRINTIRQATCTKLDESWFSPRCFAWDSQYLSSSKFYKNVPIELNDIFSGRAVIDPTKDFSLSSDGYQAIYSDATLNSVVKVAGLSFPNLDENFASIGHSVSIVDGRYGTDLLNISTWYSGLDYFASFNLFLHDRNNLAFTNFSIPTLLDLNIFDVMSLELAFVHMKTGDQLHLGASLDYLEYRQRSASVNEPPVVVTIFIFLLAFIGFKQLNGRINL